MVYNLTNMNSIFYGGTEIMKITHNGSIVYEKISGPDYFYVEAGDDLMPGEEVNVEIVKSVANAPTILIEISTNKQSWTTLGQTNVTPLTFTLIKGTKDRVYLRSTANAWAGGLNDYNHISADNKHNIGGNIMSLLWGDNFEGKDTFPSSNVYTFCKMFIQNVNLNKADKLILPVKVLKDWCYQEMFNGCTGLKAAPELLATDLAPYCYQYMFIGSDLEETPVMHTQVYANFACDGMFVACANLQRAVVPGPGLTFTNGSCQWMFNGCSSLKEVTCLTTSYVTVAALNTWMDGVSPTGTFYKTNGVSFPVGSSGIPSGWTVINV